MRFSKEINLALFVYINNFINSYILTTKSHFHIYTKLLFANLFAKNQERYLTGLQAEDSSPYLPEQTKWSWY